MKKIACLGRYLKQRDFKNIHRSFRSSCQSTDLQRGMFATSFDSLNQKVSSGRRIYFQPDLASSHYAETVCDFMIESKINFVEKYENPANLPECRPIEQFWAILKQKVYNGNWKAKNVDQLKNRIIYMATQVDRSFLANLFKSMVRTMKNIGRNGVIEQR